MSKPGIIVTIILAVVFASSSITLSILAGSYGYVSDMSPILFGAEPEAAEAEPIDPDIRGPLCGRVTRSNGDGIANARIQLRGERYDGQQFEFTDADGRFVFDEVPIHAAYRVSVRANGLVFTKPSVTVDSVGCESEVMFVAEPFE